MGKEILVYNTIKILSSMQKSSYVICTEMSTTGNNYIREIQSVSERQICHAFSNLCILDFTEIHRIWMLKITHVFEQKYLYERGLFKIVNKIY